MTDDTAVLLTPEEAARRLRIGRTRLFALIAAGDLASITIGRSRRITPRALDDYVTDLQAPALAAVAPGGETARSIPRSGGEASRRSRGSHPLSTRLFDPEDSA